MLTYFQSWKTFQLPYQQCPVRSSSSFYAVRSLFTNSAEQITGTADTRNV